LLYRSIEIVFSYFISFLRFHSSSSRALAFHEVYNILLTLKHTNNNWIKAFRYVPKRKIATRMEEDNETEDDDKENRWNATMNEKIPTII
jgi:hypothetical protein